MRTPIRGADSAVLLRCETLEDRLTPVAAYALSGANLLAFDTTSPATTTTTAITGVSAGDTLVGIDTRPQNGHLYALGFNSGAGTVQLYNLSVRTGLATPVGTTGTFVAADGTTPVPITGTGFGFDFNPLVDRIRVVTSAGQDFRINPNTGAFIDGDLGGAAGSVPGLNMDGAINGGTTTLDAAAYTNNQPNTTITTLYTLDAASDSLYIQNPPNAGTQTMPLTLTLGGATLDFTAVDGFDIQVGVNAPASNMPVTTGSGFAVLNVGGTTGLYSINLVDGVTTFVGNVANGTMAIQGMAIQNDPGGTPAIGLNTAGTSLVRFNTATPGTSTTVAITGVTAGETLVGADFRPQTGQFYGLGINGTANTGTLYLLDPQTGAATAVGTAGQIAFTTDGTTVVDLPDSIAAGYGMDFNPTVDRLRVTTSTGLNFRVNPNNGAPVDGNNGGAVAAGTNPDGAINGSGSTGVSATAYTNSFGQPLTGGVTTLYTLDPTLNMLFIQNPPNAGTQSMGKSITLNGAPLDFTAVDGFDIPSGVRVTANNAVATGFGTAALTVGGVSNLYRIDLATGAATLIGAAPAGLSGLTLADAASGTVTFQSATVTGNEGPAGVNVVLTRTGGSGPIAVMVDVVGGTATPGTDFTNGPYTVTFAEGQTTATLNILFNNDGVSEGQETVTLSITAAPGGAIGGQNTTTLTVGDTVQRFGQAFGTGASIPVVATIASNGGPVSFLTPYSNTVAGGVRVAVGDVTGDGIDDLVTVPSAAAAQVKVFSGVDGSQVASFFAYPSTVGIAANVAIGDVNNDGFGDIIVGTSTALAAVLVFSGQDFSQLSVSLPFGSVPVGINVASGDVNGDGFDDIVVGTATGLSFVAVYSGQDNSLMTTFQPFGGFTVGTTVAVGDVDNDGLADIVVGTTSVIPAIAVFNATNFNQQQALLFPFNAVRGGANVAVGDVNGDGKLDLIAGLSVSPATVRAFDPVTLAVVNDLQPFGSFGGGIFVS